MIFKTILICAVLLSLVCQNQAQTIKVIEKIKTLKILSSTRDDLRKAFGEAKDNDYPYTESFYLKEGKITADYSVGLCGENNKIGWHVPEWTITRIWFDPEKPLDPQQLKIDFTGFKKTEVFDVPGAFEYEDKKSGIGYSVTRQGKIEFISFDPPTEFNYLDCESMIPQ